jgi:hypothetical protein
LTYSSIGGLLPLTASSSLQAALLTADLSALLHLGKSSGGLGPPRSELQLHVRAPVDGLDGAVRGSGWLKRLGGEESLRYFAAVISGAVGGDGHVSAAEGKVGLASGERAIALLWGAAFRAYGIKAEVRGVGTAFEVVASGDDAVRLPASTSSSALPCLRGGTTGLRAASWLRPWIWGPRGPSTSAGRG